jgi:hypothetical protein
LRCFFSFLFKCRENENKWVKERIEVIEDKERLRKGCESLGKEDRNVHGRLGKLESEVAKDRTEGQDHKWNMKEDMEYWTQRS